jgi:hypothetical protein
MPTVINSAAEAECESGLLFKFLFPCLTPLSQLHGESKLNIVSKVFNDKYAVIS